LSGRKLFLQIVGPEIISIFSVPLVAPFPMPLSPALRITAGHLTIFDFRIGLKPPSTNSAWTLLAFYGPLHRFLSFIELCENDSRAILQKANNRD
jgi:hypothetical protein